MTKFKYCFTETQISNRIREGRGSGAVANYTPWLYVHEVPSAGRSQRVYSHLTGRIHHVLSDLEFAVFLLLDHNPTVTDIREQFPLNRDDTLEIARKHKLWHPSNVSVNQVMSSDFLVDTNDPENQKFVIQVKYTESFADKRTIEKLEIERRYWELKGIPWFLVTERQIDKVIKSNVDWLYAVKGYHDELVTADLERQMHFMSAYFQNEPERRVIDICKAFDTAYQLELGQSLHDFRQLCAARLITFDIRQPIAQLRAKEVTFRGAANNTGANYVAG